MNFEEIRKTINTCLLCHNRTLYSIGLFVPNNPAEFNPRFEEDGHNGVWYGLCKPCFMLSNLAECVENRFAHIKQAETS